MRLDKLFSNLGLLSRSECKAAVKKGRITVNGIRPASSDVKVDPDKDEICLDGSRVSTEQYVYYMFNKPSGIITANEDPDLPVVFDYIHDQRPDLAAVGRLDRDTTGLLLITNDGELNHYLLSPRHHVAKTYQVWIDGLLTQEDIDCLTVGMDIGDDKPTLPAVVNILGIDRENTWQQVELIITEGRYHQVKRMFGKLGKPVMKLHRSGFGPLVLDPDLAPGEYRELTPVEIEQIRKYDRL